MAMASETSMTRPRQEMSTSLASMSTMSRPRQEKLTAVFKDLRDDLDPEQQYGAETFNAALKSLGLEPEDVEADFVNRGMQLDPRITQRDAEKASKIRDGRKEVWDGLRQSRMKEVVKAMETLPADEVRRFNRVTLGDVRAVDWDNDIPAVESLGGMDEFATIMERRTARARADQKRKATALATNFLMEKKRMDEADKKIKAVEDRLKEYKKEQATKLKEKQNAAEKATEKRLSGARAAAEARANQEDEWEENLLMRSTRARATREKTYSTENLRSKMEASQAKRDYAYTQACDLEDKMMARLEEKRQNLERRLADRDASEAERLQLRREASQQKFQDRQIRVEAHLQDWAENKLAKHKEFVSNFDTRRANGKAELKQRSKSCFDIRKKATEKWKGNYDKLMNERAANNEGIMERHENARIKTEENAKLMLKCDNDVFSFKAVKYDTWGELQRKRHKEYKHAIDAQTQANVFRIGEQCAAMRAKKAANENLAKQRQNMAGELLKQRSAAEEAFLKIQCEPDERKIINVMNSLGFDMPKLPELDEEGGDAGESASKPAF